MKIPYTPLLFLIFFLAACNNAADYKVVRKQVIDVHDEAMLKTSRIIRNKMMLDTLVTRLDSLKKNNPALDTIQTRSEVSKLIADLNSADQKMSDWMHVFDPDVSKKSNQEAVRYFEQQLIEIKRIDSLCQLEIEKSDNYLKKINNP